MANTTIPVGTEFNGYEYDGEQFVDLNGKPAPPDIEQQYLKNKASIDAGGKAGAAAPGNIAGKVAGQIAQHEATNSNYARTLDKQGAQRESYVPEQEKYAQGEMQRGTGNTRATAQEVAGTEAQAEYQQKMAQQDGQDLGSAVIASQNVKIPDVMEQEQFAAGQRERGQKGFDAAQETRQTAIAERGLANDVRKAEGDVAAVNTEGEILSTVPPEEKTEEKPEEKPEQPAKPEEKPAITPEQETKNKALLAKGKEIQIQTQKSLDAVQPYVGKLLTPAELEEVNKLLEANGDTRALTDPKLPRVIPFGAKAIGGSGNTFAESGTVEVAVQTSPAVEEQISAATGGFTGQGGKYEPAGVVHRGEYVIPKEGVDQETKLPKPEYIKRLLSDARLKRVQKKRTQDLLSIVARKY